jgi:predicted enzyme related to lactoylglutathione lyase
VTSIGRILVVQIDCEDPVELGRFWSRLLDMPVEEVLGDPAQYLNLAPPVNAPTSPGIALQRVPEPKRGKNRVHLDIEVDDADAATERIEALGGRRTSAEDVSEHGYNWRVMADPEGNEFCLIFTQT